VAATALEVLRGAVDRLEAAAVFALSLAVLYLWNAKGAVAVVVTAAGVVGWVWGAAAPAFRDPAVAVPAARG